MWWRMMAVAARLARPNLLTPWRSPLLRWRMETYGILDDAGRPMMASSLTPAQFFQFLRDHRAALVRFLRWAAMLERVA